MGPYVQRQTQDMQPAAVWQRGGCVTVIHFDVLHMGGQPGCATWRFPEMGVAKRVPANHPNFRLGISIINQPFGGYAIYGNPQKKRMKILRVGRPQHPKCFESAKLHPTAQWCSGATACPKAGENLKKDTHQQTSLFNGIYHHYTEAIDHVGLSQNVVYPEKPNG